MRDRIRLNLEGVTLDDLKGRLTATFRYRTTKGLVLNLPESVDVLVTWEHIDAVHLDLKKGVLVIRLKEEYVGQHRWLHGSQELRGQWLDRVEL